jgi:hypothetical protein
VNKQLAELTESSIYYRTIYLGEVVNLCWTPLIMSLRNFFFFDMLCLRVVGALKET